MKMRVKSLLLALGMLPLMGACGLRSIPMQKNEVDAAWADVLVQYQRRADLIPNLVEAVKGYAKHEKDTLTGVVEARAKATQMRVEVQELTPENLARFEKAQQQIGGMLSHLMAIAEQYPDLKANQNFRDIQVALEGTENRIAVARSRFVTQVKDFNNLVTVFPTSLTNSVLFHFQPKPQFTADESAATAPKVKF